MSLFKKLTVKMINRIKTTAKHRNYCLDKYNFVIYYLNIPFDVEETNKQRVSTFTLDCFSDQSLIYVIKGGTSSFS